MLSLSTQTATNANIDYFLAYYEDPNNSRVRNNSRDWQNVHILITVGCGIKVGCSKKVALLRYVCFNVIYSLFL